MPNPDSSGLLFYNANILSTHWNAVNFFADINNLILLAIVLLSGGALVTHTLQRLGARVSPLQATQLLNQGKSLLLDVRNAEEFAAGHAKDAKNIPLKELAERAGELEKFKSCPVITVCARGLQSHKAVAILKKQGFEQVNSLLGGMEAWQAQGLPVSKSKE